MRSFQVIRHRRRTTISANELSQSIIQSSDLTTTPRRQSSILMSHNENHPNSNQYDENDNLIAHRRHTLSIPKSLSTLDTYDISRRPSLNNGRRLSFQQQEITESSKSKTSLRNFYIFFVLLFLFIFLAVFYSFIRMIKNQSS
ncbi:unnamed protein product [Rotaria sp. Silwood2]|nr:unnamed protein product [Rotaria sp. Silwood2]CAF2691960.1 unnamed protein product [Rotaria sp. Silwood2]CAF2940349.1 unnamed protein product [Rotaria sp. Silwood2]CAF3084607.1 unnamed protein product [Rotaria sp. Silwood2]CAF3906904.1 unnamed protein product [Rotaria sp. Silwood2]